MWTKNTNGKGFHNGTDAATRLIDIFYQIATCPSSSSSSASAHIRPIDLLQKKKVIEKEFGTTDAERILQCFHSMDVKGHGVITLQVFLDNVHHLWSTTTAVDTDTRNKSSPAIKSSSSFKNKGMPSSPAPPLPKSGKFLYRNIFDAISISNSKKGKYNKEPYITLKILVTALEQKNNRIQNIFFGTLEAVNIKQLVNIFQRLDVHGDGRVTRAQWVKGAEHAFAAPSMDEDLERMPLKAAPALDSTATVPQPPPMSSALLDASWQCPMPIMPTTMKTASTESTDSCVADRTVECEGYMTKRGQKYQTWKRRYFVLKHAEQEQEQHNLFVLSYYTNKKSYDKGQAPKGSLELSENEVVVCLKNEAFASKEYAFEVSTPSRTLLLHCDTKVEMEKWFQRVSCLQYN